MTQATSTVLAPNISGTDLRTQINDIVEAIITGHGGASRPSYLDATREGVWVKEVSGTVREIYYWDKAQDILQGTIDTAANSFTPAGSSVQFGGLYYAKTGAFTAVNGENGALFACNATSASFTATIDTTSSLDTGWFAIFQKTDSTGNTVTIDPTSTDTVNGATTLVLSRQFDSAIVIKIGATSFAGLLMPNPASLAPLNSPTFTGTPAAPTAAPGTNSTQIATTGFVAASYAPLASPALTGTPTAPTQTTGNNTTRLATTAFVQQEIAANVPTGVITTLRTQQFTASGTYTPHPNMVYCRVFVKGGGGGGGGAGGGVGACGGGGEGGWGWEEYSDATIGASQSVTIGAGGSAGGSDAVGGTGGTTSFGALLSATGGVGGGGRSTTALGGAGGTCTTGTLNGRGACGGSVISTTLSGFGGGSGGGAGVATNANGNSGVANSGGGASGAVYGSGATKTGGVGGSGYCVVQEYCSA